MSFSPNYPTSLDVLANPTATTNRDDAGFELHGVISRIQDILEALEAKLGTGASTPGASAAILRRTGAGASAWGQIADADVAANTFSASKINAGGTANRVIATADGATTGLVQVATAMLATDAVHTLATGTLSSSSVTPTPPTTAPFTGSVSITTTFAGGRILALAVGAAFNTVAGNTTVLGLTIDGANSVEQALGTSTANSAYVPFCCAALTGALSVGAHSFGMFARVTGGTATLNGATFVLMEIKR